MVGSTSDAAFAVDPQGRILAWNPAAEALFGYRPEQAVRGFCWQILQGRDVFGNDYCCRACQIRQMAFRSRSVHPCELEFLDAAGGRRHVRVVLLRVRDRETDASALVHVASAAGPEEAADIGAQANGTNPRNGNGITRREMEILGHLAEGKRTAEIGAALGLSSTTVRNHVQHLLHKLRAHSRLEAVAQARRLNLLCR